MPKKRKIEKNIGRYQDSTEAAGIEVVGAADVGAVVRSEAGICFAACNDVFCLG